MSRLFAPPATTATTRISMRFSADGSMAACLAVHSGQPYQPERWTFTSAAERSRLLPTAGGETLYTQLLPLPGKRVLLIRHQGTSHDLVGLTPDRAATRERRLATITAQGFRLLPGAAHRTLAVSWDQEQSMVWQVDPATGRLKHLAVVPGMLGGGLALDLTGHELGFTRYGADGATAIGLDLATGVVRPLAAGCSHLLLADPASGLAVLAARTCDGPQLAYLSGHAVVIPTRLNQVDGTVLPLAAAPGGDAVALRVNRGARSRLYLHRVADDSLGEIDIPAGVIGATAAWSASGLRFPYTSPVCPSGIARVTPGMASWRLAGVAGEVGQRAHQEWFPGPAGPIEAVVYGDWCTATHVVVALHGGPRAAWEMDFHPLLQQLAAAGLAVVAPNQRGSTGYGTAHAAAIHGAWGGPDRQDIRHLGSALRRRRAAGAAAPALYGESYGAYLALLTAAHAPGLWSSCAAVAPFLSGARLYDEASDEVRGMIARLGGRAGLPGNAGDLAVVAGRIAVPVLIIHGSDDETVPVSQSRHLRELLHAAGRNDVRYAEIPGAGHDPLSGPGGQAITGQLAGFLCGARRASSRDRPVTRSPHEERR